jgi:hypothetical protein
MKVTFDGTQYMLRQILALMGVGESVESSCPHCGKLLHPISVSEQSTAEQQKWCGLACSGCSSSWPLTPREKTKRELIWERFEQEEQEEMKQPRRED